MDDNKLPSLVSPSFGKTDEEAKDVKLVEGIHNTELYGKSMKCLSRGPWRYYTVE